MPRAEQSVAVAGRARGGRLLGTASARHRDCRVATTGRPSVGARPRCCSASCDCAQDAAPRGGRHRGVGRPCAGGRRRAGTTGALARPCARGGALGSCAHRRGPDARRHPPSAGARGVQVELNAVVITRLRARVAVGDDCGPTRRGLVVRSSPIRPRFGDDCVCPVRGVIGR